jgi:hypothetical protein
MANPEQAKKWREEHNTYRKDWYTKNKARVRAEIKRKYYEAVTKKRMEEALAFISDDDWRPIPGFENYRINEKGEIINKFGKLLKPGKVSNGYMHVSLSNANIKCKHMYVHHLVWITFKGEVPKGLIICHKDTNKENNALDNLCVMTYRENFNKPLTIEHFKRSQEMYPRENLGRKKKKVYQYDSDGNLVNTWESIIATKDGGFSPSSVSRCCSGKCEAHKGFVWSFKETL